VQQFEEQFQGSQGGNTIMVVKKNTRPEYLPPRLTAEKATGNNALDALGYTMFPHIFTDLPQRSGPDGQLSQLIVVLFFLWDATVGHAQKEDFDRKKGNPQGRISLRQIPIRRQQTSKWLHALLAAGLFRRLEKAQHDSKVGSLYEYNNQTETTEWVDFFERAAWAVQLKGDLSEKGDPSTEQFARFFLKRTPVPTSPADDIFATPEEHRAEVKKLLAKRKEGR